MKSIILSILKYERVIYVKTIREFNVIIRLVTMVLACSVIDFDAVNDSKLLLDNPGQELLQISLSKYVFPHIPPQTYGGKKIIVLLSI